jgi:hypothetical protein
VTSNRGVESRGVKSRGVERRRVDCNRASHSFNKTTNCCVRLLAKFVVEIEQLLVE